MNKILFILNEKYRIRFKIRGPFGWHKSENFVHFQLSSFIVVYIQFYSKFNEEFKFLGFNTNGGLENNYFHHSLHQGELWQKSDQNLTKLRNSEGYNLSLDEDRIVVEGLLEAYSQGEYN